VAFAYGRAPAGATASLIRLVGPTAQRCRRSA
jgi:hypothetical protein